MRALGISAFYHDSAAAIVDDERCVDMMTDFIAANPGLWNEDIGVAEDEGAH